MSNKSKQDPKELAQSIGLVDIDTEQAIDDIFHDMLLSTYRHNPKAAWEKDINKKIEQAYRDNFNSEWVTDNDKVLSTLLLGSPGQGKTTAFKEAGKKLAAALELNFVINPGDEFKPSRKDFVFISQEFSGENSSVTVGGIPSKVSEKMEIDGEEQAIDYMKKLYNKRFVVCNASAASCLLLDDFPNASQSVQNVALSLTDEKRFQGLNLFNTYIGLTGNLGALDGTHTTRLSTALRGRCKVFFTQDVLPKFINRTQQKFKDDLGDCGVLGFLNRLPQFFAEMPNPRHSGGFPAPRNWDHAILEFRRAVRKAGGGAHAIKDIQIKANSLLGIETGTAFYSYFYSLMQNADPLARECIQTGKINETELKRKFSEGFSANEQHFAYQFAIALSDYSVRRIANDKNSFEETMTRFANGTLAMSEDVVPFAIDNFKMQLANQVDEFATKGQGSKRQLVLDVKKKIVTIFNNNKNCTRSHIELLIDAITDADKMDMSTRRRRRA